MASDLQKYIQESQKIDNGPPVRYQLQPKRVNLDKEADGESKLRRFTLGTQDPKYPNRTVLLVGATGSGKSTLINVLVNFVMGVEFEKKVWFEIIADEKVQSQSDSQTSAVSVYEIFGFEGKTLPYSLTIIDTPGFGDTKGIEYDDIIPKKLQDLFSVPDGVDSIDAVGLVLKASDNRLDERMAYILNSVTSLFGKDMEQNIMVMITHSEGRKPNSTLRFLDDAKIKCARDINKKPVYFSFNNSQKETIEDDSDDEKEAERAFGSSNKGMKKFTEFLGKTKPTSLKSTLEVMRERIRLTACIQNARERVVTIELKQEAFKNNKAKLAEKGKVTGENQNIMISIDETYKEKEEIGGWWDNKAVTCNNCKENCHYPGCTWAWGPSWCEVMKKGKCTSCTGKCPVDCHVKEKKKYVDKIRTVTKPAVELRNLENRAKPESVAQKNVWIVGHSLIYWAESRAKSPEVGMQLGMDPSRVNLWWRGTQGMTWSQLLPQLHQLKVLWPNPDVLIVHLGGNDLNDSPTDLLTAVRRDLASVRSIFPRCLLVWSHILPRRAWRHSNDSHEVDLVRSTVNRRIHSVLIELGGVTLSHDNIRCGANTGLYRSDGVHLSPKGIDVFNLNLQDLLEKWEQEVNKIQ